MVYKKGYFQNKSIRFGENVWASFEEVFIILKKTFPSGFLAREATPSLREHFNVCGSYYFAGSEFYKRMVKWGVLTKENLMSKQVQPLYYYKFAVQNLEEFYSILMKEEILESLEDKK